jgi:hypothetical protein
MVRALLFPDLFIPGLLLAVLVGGGMLGAATLLARADCTLLSWQWARQTHLA